MIRRIKERTRSPTRNQLPLVLMTGSTSDLVARTADSLRFVLERHASEMETVVFVGHDSVNRALLLQLLDQPLSAYWRIAQEPCAINEIDVLDGRICVQRINETQHLERIT